MSSTPILPLVRLMPSLASTHGPVARKKQDERDGDIFAYHLGRERGDAESQ
jgi:hypothetical protein